jgi:hypothetical protein
MRPAFVLTALASLSAVQAAAIANPAPKPAPAPEPATALLPFDLPGLDGVSGVTGVIGRLDTIGGILGPVTTTGGVLGGLIPTVSALLDGIAGILSLPSVVVASVAPITGATGAVPILGTIRAGSVTGDEATRLADSVKSVIRLYTTVLEAIFERTRVFTGIPIVGNLIYSVLLTIKGALDVGFGGVVVCCVALSFLSDADFFLLFQGPPRRRLRRGRCHHPRRPQGRRPPVQRSLHQGRHLVHPARHLRGGGVSRRSVCYRAAAAGWMDGMGRQQVVAHADDGSGGFLLLARRHSPVHLWDCGWGIQ